MNYNPCILVPHYNHHAQATPVLEALNKTCIPILLIDDGSSPDNLTGIRSATANLKNIKLIEFPRNRGKGAAVLTGFTLAQLDGYTHALQVDADGQHDIGDISKFLELSQANPDSIIAGRPVFDASVPSARKWGRKITDAMVVIETLSLKFPDAMCGYRIYPLDKIIDVLDSYHIGSRMDFDTEILVKSHWSGVPCTFIPTKVIYPENGASNFRMLEDNISISKMHTRLIICMFLNLPKLLARKLGLKKTR